MEDTLSTVRGCLAPRRVACLLAATLLAPAVLAGTACREGRADSHAADVEAILAADGALQEAVTARDLERTLSFYAPDAALLPAAVPAAVGSDAIRKEWARVYAIPGFDHEASLTKVEVSTSGDLAYTQGTYEATMAGADGTPTRERGKWVSVWKRQPDASWKIVMDTYNTDAPPAKHEQSPPGMPQ